MIQDLRFMNKKGFLNLGCLAALGCGFLAIFPAVFGILGFAWPGDPPTLGGGGVGAFAGVADPNSEQILLYKEVASCDETRLTQAIDNYIARNVPNSPMKGLGRVFVETGKQSGINPLFLVAQAKHESSFGTAPPSTGGEANTTDVHNPFGRKASSGQPSITNRGGTWYKFSSWEEAIELQGPFMVENYINLGYNTLEKYINRYAPPSDNNDVSAYMRDIGEVNSQIKQIAGCGG